MTSELFEWEGRQYPLEDLRPEDIQAGSWILGPEQIGFLIVQVMNDQAEPYMMIRALDGSRIRLVNNEDYSSYRKIVKD